jgi:hypothetical protein
MTEADTLKNLVRATPDFNFRNLLEALALLSGHKAVMRLSVHSESEPILRVTLESLGLVCIRSDYRQKTSFSSNLGDSYTEAVPFEIGGDLPYTMMISQKGHFAEKAIEMEDRAFDFKGLGRLLGYPECCIHSYEHIEEGNDWLKVYLSNTPLQFHYDHRNNKLSYLFSGMTLFFDYFPCSLTCRSTMEISDTMVKILESFGISEIAASIRSEMLTPVLILEGLLIFLSGSSLSEDGKALTYDLTRSRHWLWELHKGIEDHFFWDSDNIRIRDHILECYQGDILLGHVQQTEFQRLLIFR